MRPLSLCGQRGAVLPLVIAGWSLRQPRVGRLLVAPFRGERIACTSVDQGRTLVLPSAQRLPSRAFLSTDLARWLQKAWAEKIFAHISPETNEPLSVALPLVANAADASRARMRRCL